ncbi:MAG: dTDP-4-dehydrorhamnose reductase [Nitrospiria bacterium]
MVKISSGSPSSSGGGSRILLLGKSGQVGWELQRTLSPLGELIALGRQQLDLTRPDQIRARVREIKPGLIVNAAAYTAVDRAEDEPDLAMAINGTAPGLLAEEANRMNATLIHYSTDYVFGENVGSGLPSSGYTEEMEPHPLNVYGQTKLAGERAVQATARSYLILRTSWVYGSRGNNFLLTILRLAREREELKVVDDQIGAPTWSRMIAEATAQIVARSSSAASMKEASGLYHLAAAGRTTWYRFAQSILKHDTSPHCRLKRLLPITTADYPTRARRPAFGLLNCGKLSRAFGLALPNWETGLASALREIHADDEKF